MGTKERILDFGYFRLARNESLKALSRTRVGAVLVRGRKPISVGHNQVLKTHTEARKYSKFGTIHAEMDAIFGLDRELVEGGVMYVYREDRHGKVGSSKPCERCLKFLGGYRVKKVYYIRDDRIESLKLA